MKLYDQVTRLQWTFIIPHAETTLFCTNHSARLSFWVSELLPCPFSGGRPLWHQTSKHQGMRVMEVILKELQREIAQVHLKLKTQEHVRCSYISDLLRQFL